MYIRFKQLQLLHVTWSTFKINLFKTIILNSSSNISFVKVLLLEKKINMINENLCVS